MSPRLIRVGRPQHSTSGASETIFMNLRARSSRATGPKTRVPIGSLICVVDQHGGVLVETDVGPVRER